MYGFNPCPKPRHALKKKRRLKDIPKDIRRFVYERDNKCCVRCGNPHNLQLHHIITKGRYDPRRYNFKQGVHDPRNLATVCVGCHRKIHDQPEAMLEMLEWQRLRFGEVLKYVTE
ncbi:HNH endonuclease [Aneurinibacillus migulanus]|uniref:HNH endonuclease n=1 Tax=Aneurinibacillus migulanus TaxID=47500 RepID=A0A0D1YF32_ANEMI|nr:hypothetical protein TS65_09920 [Aneurinibacillus migulanus]KON94855.1 hypothetical protein AF333_04505 [Aneurinibacillus migulanus]GED14020.1 hypothetical protein AMI01nite_20110 [Aneurinibacillus migulanus]SDI91644.1 HNH endonuclease [Aneurinibacillus migulanus]